MQLFGNISTGNILTGNILTGNISTENISIGRGVIILKIFDKKSNAFSFVNKKLSIDAPKRSGYIFFRELQIFAEGGKYEIKQSYG